VLPQRRRRCRPAQVAGRGRGCSGGDAAAAREGRSQGRQRHPADPPAAVGVQIQASTAPVSMMAWHGGRVASSTRTSETQNRI